MQINFVSLQAQNRKFIMRKFIICFVSLLLVIAFISCKKEKCRYYNDIMNYYDQSEETWTTQYQQGIIDSTDYSNHIYSIQQQRLKLQQQNKKCVVD